EREVGGGRLQRLGGPAPAVAGVVRGVAEPQVLGEVGALALALAGAARVRQAGRVRHGGLPYQGREGAAHVEVPHAERVEAGEGRGRRVAGHHVGGAVDVDPAVPHAAVLPGEVVQRLGVVARDLRLEQREQLGVGAVLVPAGEVAVLHALAALQPVHPHVAAAVAAVGVAGHVRLHVDGVERGVDLGQLGRRAAGDPDGGEPLVPGPAGGGGHRPDVVVPLHLVLEVAPGRGDARVRDADLGQHVLVAGGVEGHVAAGAAAGPVGAGGVPLA